MNTKHNVFTGNKRLVVAISVVAGGLWLAMFVYILWGDSISRDKYTPATVEVHSSSPVANGLAVAPSARQSKTTSFAHSGATSATPTAHNAFVPSQGMQSTSMHLHETSSATVHTIGSGSGGSGGGNTGGSGNTNGSNGSGRGIHTTAMAYSGAIHIAVPFNAITEPGAVSANEMASIVTENPRAVTDRRRVGEDPFDPFLDPIGDVTWGLMALLAAAYAVYVYRRKLSKHT